MTKLLDHRGQPIPAGAGRRARVLALGEPPYRGADVVAPDLSNWHPSRVSADGAVGWDLNTLAARAEDLYRNSGPIRTAAQAKRTKLVGAGWTIVADPDHEALGLSREEGAALGRALSRAWAEWSADPRCYCDVTRRMTFNQLLGVIALTQAKSGEAWAVLRWRERPGWRWRTALQLVDGARVSNPLGEPDSEFLRRGIELDEDGGPLAVHIQRHHPSDTFIATDQLVWDRVPWQEPSGRPVVLHHFDIEGPDQLRGVPAVATLLRRVKMLERYADAELGRATIQALFVAFIKSGFDPATVAESFQDTADAAGYGEQWHAFRAGFYAENDVRLTPDSPKMPVLPPGDDISLNGMAGAQSGFNDFQRAFLQEFASVLGVPYPELANDWAGVNYSSMRAALNEDWKRVSQARMDLRVDVVQRVYMAVIEEAILAGHVSLPESAPAFWDAVGAYARLRAIGPGRGFVDPVKEAQAYLIALEGGLTTTERVLAEQGLTLDEVIASKQREAEALAAAGLNARDVRGLLGPQGASDSE